MKVITFPDGMDDVRKIIGILTDGYVVDVDCGWNTLFHSGDTDEYPGHLDRLKYFLLDYAQDLLGYEFHLFIQPHSPDDFNLARFMYEAPDNDQASRLLKKDNELLFMIGNTSCAK